MSEREEEIPIKLNDMNLQALIIKATTIKIIIKRVARRGRDLVHLRLI